MKGIFTYHSPYRNPLIDVSVTYYGLFVQFFDALPRTRCAHAALQHNFSSTTSTSLLDHHEKQHINYGRRLIAISLRYYRSILPAVQSVFAIYLANNIPIEIPIESCVTYRSKFANGELFVCLSLRKSHVNELVRR